MNNLTMRSALRSPLLALALVAVFAGTALATGASGFAATPLARGTIGEPFHVNVGDLKLQTKGAVDVATATVVVSPGGTSGWHSHPGIVIVTVKAGGGSLTFYDKNCVATVHAPGTTFIEVDGDGPGMARNEGTTDTFLYVTYLVPTGVALRIDEPAPACAS